MDQLEEEIDRLSEEIDRLRRELASSRSRENAPPAANPDGDLSGTSTTRGRQYDGLITDVGPFQAVVAINLGSNDGLRETMLLHIFDDRGELAQVVLSNVQPDFSIARVLPGFGNPNRLKKDASVSVVIQ